GWLTLFVRPFRAIAVVRPLVLAAYDFAASGEAFFVGIAYGLAGGSIYFTAHVITNLCSNRFRLEINRIVQSRIDKAWASAILLALLINILVGASASKPVLSYSGGIAVDMVAGMLVAFAGVYEDSATSSHFIMNSVYTL